MFSHTSKAAFIATSLDLEGVTLFYPKKFITYRGDYGANPEPRKVVRKKEEDSPKSSDPLEGIKTTQSVNFKEPDSDSNITFVDNGVRSGTFSKLVEKLTASNPAIGKTTKIPSENYRC